MPLSTSFASLAILLYFSLPIGSAIPLTVLQPHRQLLLVSLDGFRHDYLRLYANETQFLRAAAAQGVFVPAMQTEFVTKTFPNHWSLATGRHQESHGIVSNSMYDSVFNATFSMRTREERWWNDSLPIWATAKRQGFKTATFFWPGSEVEFGGTRPDHYYEYDGSIPYEFRIDTVTRWLADEGINLCTLYFDEPDSSGHNQGPESTNVANIIYRLNHLLELLMFRLESRGIRDRVDVIITSDHGMSQLNSSKVVNFDNALDPYVERYMDSGPLLSMFAKPGMLNQLVEYLQNETTAKSLPIRVFTKDSLPSGYHYTRHRRVPDVLVLPNPGYLVFRRSTNVIKGNHGFDNAYEDMKVPLIAFGPSFKRGMVVKDFRQVDVYGLACHLLGIRPQANNGTTELFSTMLLDKAGTPSVAAVGPLTALALSLVATASRLLLIG